MAVKIKSVKKLVDMNGIKILIHGLAGAGKTVMCCTTGAPTLIISAESGLLSVRDAPEYIKAAEIESLEDLEDLYQYLVDAADEPDFEWVALDSITEIAERILATEKKLAKDPRQAYGELIEQTIDLLKRFRDLRGYNVVMSCKQQRIADDMGGPAVFAPMMPGAKLYQQIPYLFDEVFALRVEKDEEGDDYRVVQTSRDTRYEAKDRSGALEMFEEPNLKKIAAKIRASSETPDPKKDEKKKLDEAQEPEEVEVVEEAEVVEEPVDIATKTMYWVHHESEVYGVVKKGEELVEAPGVEYITKKMFDALPEDYADDNGAAASQE